MDNSRQSEQALMNCSFVKTILMLLVVLGHACAFWDGTWFTKNPVIPSNGLSIISSWLGSFHIYAFTLVSGYLFAAKVSGGGYQNYPAFLKTKAKRLLVPYVFVMLIWVAPVSEYYFKYELPALIEKYILCISPSQLWFLWMLFGVFAIVWPLRKTMIEKPITGWMIAIAFYGVSIVGGKFIPNVFCILTACQHIVFFYVGIRIMVKTERHEDLLTQRIPWYGWLIVDIMLFIADRMLKGQTAFIWKLAVLGIDFVLHIIGAIMAWTILQAIASRVRWHDNKIFKKLASYSMPIYLFHQQIIYFVITALNGAVNPWINAGANFLVALIGSSLISAFLMRWRTTRFLIGEKV